ncbi:polysaccharide deacetylase family protein [Candidatus Peregrinibacteria bacterium]|nr:polysaccharide deacetylase family protein [Candidatus Peregrinibacteria bacterium]
MLFTTSWDDGYKKDLKVADLLSEYGMTGTFYVCPKIQFKEAMLTKDEIRVLSRTNEIGAHTINHPKLTKIPQAEARKEINESKAWIEDITGKPCTMFCYPYGDHNADIARMVRDAGFRGARTVVPLEFSATDPFTMPTTLQIYPFPWRRRWKRLSHYANPLGHDREYWKKLLHLHLPLKAHFTWLNCAKALFDHALSTRQPWFHLWGHSEELQRYGMWGNLEKFLAFVQRHDIRHVTNAQILESIS